MTAKSSANCILAHAYEEDKHEILVKNWWISEKYDGVRGIWDGKNMMSRNGNIYTIPDFIREQLEKITIVKDEKNINLDGEIWFGKDTFAICSGAARKRSNDPEVWKMMTYLVFDIQDTEMLFEDRIKMLSVILKRDDIPNIKKVVYRKFKPSETTMANELKKVEDNGGEGLMIRKPKSEYVFTRSHDMLKVKSWTYHEATVIEYIQGSGRLKGLVGSLLVKTNEISEDGSETVFRVGTGFTDWQRQSGMNKEDTWNRTTSQAIITEHRKKNINPNKPIEVYQQLVDIIKSEKGKARQEALYQLNKVYVTMPIIGDIITFRYKEETSEGKPSFPTFVSVRNYE